MNKLFDQVDRQFGQQDNNTPDNNEGNDNEPESYLAELVGEGKKFQDPESLAKGKWHADKYASRLENENETLRQELQKRLTAEELVKQLRSANKENNPPRDNEDNDDTNNLNQNHNVKDEVLNEVKKLLDLQKHQTQAERNVERIERELQAAWGANFRSKLAARAKELDLEQDYLASLAETRPDTFLKIIAPKQNQGTDYAPPSSSNRISDQRTQERTKAYYDKIRKENPKLYFSREIQAQEHRDAIRLGDRFFS